MKIGVVGLGNMGFGIAKNLMLNKHEVTGFDINPERMQKFREEGGIESANLTELGKENEIVFVMVLNASQAKDVILGFDGLLSVMRPQSVIVITATIGKAAVLEIKKELDVKGIELVDCPVSGGQGGANSGTLTLMVSCPEKIFDRCDSVFRAIAKNINHVGEKPGDGQTVKHVLSALTGTCYIGIFEALVLGAKAGVNMESLYNVISTSTVGNYIFKDSAKLIMERKFRNTGSAISTMNKDIGLSLDLARDNGVSMPMTSVAREFFQAGMSVFPDEDNWCIVKLFELMAGGIEVKRN